MFRNVMLCCQMCCMCMVQAVPICAEIHFLKWCFAGGAQSSACIFVAIRFTDPVKVRKNAALPDSFILGRDVHAKDFSH